jgi:hypothetical protein
VAAHGVQAQLIIDVGGAAHPHLSHALWGEQGTGAAGSQVTAGWQAGRRLSWQQRQWWWV